MFRNGSGYRVATLAIAAFALAACSKKDNSAVDTTAASSTISADTSTMTSSAPVAGTWTDANIFALLDEANAADSSAGAVKIVRIAARRYSKNGPLRER